MRVADVADAPAGLLDEISEPFLFCQAEMIDISSVAPCVPDPLQGGRYLGALLIFQSMRESLAFAAHSNADLPCRWRHSCHSRSPFGGSG